jgi:predicted AAA+ superfamily ATPase
MIIREIEKILISRMDREKIIMLFGARQVGKTTLFRMMIEKTGGKTVWLNGDDAIIRTMFERFSDNSFKALVGNPDIVVIDEAQQLHEIGRNLKILHDSAPGFQLLVSGSSAFDLRNKTSEPLTGRKWEYHLYPFSFNELAKETSPIEEIRKLPLRLLFGMYPEIVTHPGDEKARLQLLMESYLYKDVLMWQGIRNPENIVHLLKALAYQVGSEVKFNELSGLLKMDRQTVEKYIHILEKTFVIFRLPSFSTNLRKELSKGKKIYFFDNGIRNILTGDFSPVETRQDIGALWENFIVSEIWKKYRNTGSSSSFYFWRTNDQQEVDLIIRDNGVLKAYEIKWNPSSKARLSKTFSSNYPNNTFDVINRDNYASFLLNDI